MNVPLSRSITAAAMLVACQHAQANVALPVDATAQAPASGTFGIGYYVDGSQTTSYRRILGSRHTIERESDGLVLFVTQPVAAKKKPTAEDEADAVAVAFTSTAQAEQPTTRRNKAWKTWWLQLPVNKDSVYSGDSALDGVTSAPTTFRIGTARTVLREGNKARLTTYWAATYIDESVQFTADNAIASGSLKGSEVALGLLSRLDVSRNLSVSLGWQYTVALLEFERSIPVGTIEFPSNLNETDRVTRVRHSAWIAGASLRVLKNLYVDASLSYRNEASGTFALTARF